MSVTVMKVKSAADVKGSKNLRVYEFVIEDSDQPKVVVANLTNVYQVDDFVMVADVGTTLPGDFKIEKRKVFGIESSGMALGKTERHPGTEISMQEVENLFKVS